MSDEYSLSEGSIVIDQGNIIWSTDAQNNSVQYVVNENSLSDSTLNEAYVTAIDDSSQYFSVLETSNDNDVTLEDLHNFTLENSKTAFLDNLIIADDNSVDSKETEENDADKHNVVVFEIDNDIYGIQAAEDDYGNLQKYKFKFRTTEDGQLEAIPESVELVSTDEIPEISEETIPITETPDGRQEDPVEAESENGMDFQIEDQTEEHTEGDTDNIYIKGEVYSETEYGEEGDTDSNELIEQADNIKEEIVKEFETTSYARPNKNNQFLEVLTYSPIEEESLPSPNIEIDRNQTEFYENGGSCYYQSEDNDSYIEATVDDETLEIETCAADCEETVHEKEINASEEHHIINETDQTNEEIVVNNGQSEQSPVELQSEEEFVHEIFIEENQNIPVECADNDNPEERDIVHYIEPSKQQPQSNPRSILKRSFVSSPAVSKALRPIRRVETDCDVLSCMDEIYHNKRFARNRDVQEVKKFHNFLNRTTIPEAPVRKSRLPRKQQITTSSREDNEIVVQEVLVSSNGIVGPLHDMFQRNLNVAVTAVVELSDSDDDTIPSIKKKLCHRDTLVSRGESEASIIEIYPGDENIENNPLEASKRPRGRPRKPEVKGRPPCINPNLPNPTKKEIRCPYCSKTFPSQNSMNTHIHHHNLENSLRNTHVMQTKPRPSLLPSLEYNHKCQDCEQCFKNSILLQRHACPKKSAMHNCTHCPRKFVDVSLFNIHKKTHAKASLVKNTSNAIVSPKKSKTAGVFRSPQKSVFKCPKKSAVNLAKVKEYRCQDCSKLCSSDVNLRIHQKTHKKFTCTSCSATFTSRILLDSHVRLNCVKVRSPSNKRLSLKIRKSFVNSPARRMSLARSKLAENDSQKDTTLNQSTSSLFDLECEICKTHFSTYRNLFTHKVQKHGFSTPDKSVTAKPKKNVLYKPKPAHGGIPTNDRMKKAYAALRQKLAENSFQMQSSTIISS